MSEIISRELEELQTFCSLNVQQTQLIGYDYSYGLSLEKDIVTILSEPHDREGKIYRMDIDSKTFEKMIKLYNLHKEFMVGEDDC